MAIATDITMTRKTPYIKGYAIVLAAGLGLYVLSCAPGAMWQDSGMYQYRIWQGDVRGGMGLALAHPLYIMLGMVAKLIPLGEYGFRVNLISAVAAAFTVANVFLLLWLWLGRLAPAIVGAVTLALSWTFWQHGSITEVYTLYTALLSAELICLLVYFRSGRKWALCMVGLVNGLSIANHMLGVIPLSCYVVLFAVLLGIRRVRLRDAGLFILFWVIGAAPYEWLIVERLVATGDIAGTLSSAMFGDSWSSAVLNTSMSLKIVAENMLFIGLSFPTPNLLLFFAGVWVLYKFSPARPFGRIIIVLVALFFIFAFRYTVPDRYAFFIPFYCLASICIGLGADAIFERYPAGRRYLVTAVLVFAVLPVGVYAIVPSMAEKAGVSLGTKRTIPYRNDYTYFLQPWKCSNDGPGRFAADALSNADKNAIIFADGTTVYALWYHQTVNGVRGDIRIVSSHGDYQSPISVSDAQAIDRLAATESLYVVSPVAGYCPKHLLDNYDFARAGALYRVTSRKD